MHNLNYHKSYCWAVARRKLQSLRRVSDRVFSNIFHRSWPGPIQPATEKEKELLRWVSALATDYYQHCKGC